MSNFIPFNKSFYCEYLNLFDFDLKGFLNETNETLELVFGISFEKSFYFSELKEQYLNILKLISI